MKSTVWMNMRPWIIFAGVFLALWGFGSRPDLFARGGNDEIRIGDGKGDWGAPNPYAHYPRGPGYIRMSWVFDTLIWKDKDGAIPALATSWAYYPETRSFVFQLRKGVKWHDGKEFSSADVVFTIDYFKQHPYCWVSLDAVAGAQADGPYSVTIKLKRPYAPFLSYVGGALPIIPKHIWKDVPHPQRFTQPESFIGTGPFQFRDFNKAKGTYLYTAYDDYYQGRPRIRRLIYIKTKNPLMSLLSGRADLVTVRPDMAGILKEKGMVVLEDQRGWNKKLMINHRKPPLDDKRFRKALAHAINRLEIIDKAHQGLGSVAAFGLLSPDHEFYNPDTPDYAYEPARTGEILESLGYEKDAQGFYMKDNLSLKLELLTSDITAGGEPMADRDGEVIRKQLESAGIRVELVNLEQTSADNRVRNWKFDLAISGHGGLLGDPEILNLMISPEFKGSVNSARYGKNQTLLDLLSAQVAEMDPEVRKRLVFQIQEVYADDLPAISLYYPASTSAYNPARGIDWYYTKGGLALGIPLPQNKMSLIR
ncbi:MAG: ABC transporter substrate-binding protein [Desulfatiglandaceae bacterium]